MLQGILSEVNKLTSSDIVKLYERLMTVPPGNNPQIASTEEDFKEEFKVVASELADTKLFQPSSEAYATTIIYNVSAVTVPTAYASDEAIELVESFIITQNPDILETPFVQAYTDVMWK